MANIVERILVVLGLKKDEFSQGAKAAKQESHDLAESLKGATSGAGLLQGAMQAAGVLGVAMLAKEAASAAYALGTLGAQVNRSEVAFRDLAAQAGGSADEILAALQRATDGTVANSDLIAAANRGILLGLGAQADQWEQLAEVARYRARAMGISMTQALNDIATGIGRESRMILDNLGIILDVETATAKYAATLGKTADQLTAIERKQAILDAVLTEGQTQIKAAGGIATDSADSFARLDASMANLKGTIARGLVPTVTELADGLNGLVNSAAAAADNDLLKLLLLGPKMALESSKFGSDIGEKIGGLGDEMVSDLADAVYDLSMAQESLNLALAGGDPAQIAAWRAEVERLQALIPELLTASTDASSARWAALGASFSGVAGAVGEVGDAAGDVAGKVATWDVGFHKAGASANNIWKIIVKIRDDVNHIDFDEMESGLQSALGSATSTLAGLAGTVDFSVVGALYADAQAQLEALYAEAGQAGRKMTEMELAYREELILGSLQDTVSAYGDAGKDSADAFSSAFEDMKSTVAAALQPTSVSALDYLPGREDAWDENARRLDAIAARGGAELIAHPDWEDILMIPPDVLAAGDEALKAWASQTSSDVRSLFRPDLLAGSLDQMVETVRGYVLDQEAREGKIEEVTAAYQTKYGGSAADAKKMAKMLLGDTSQVGETVADDLAAGMKKSMGQGSLTATLVATWRTDVDANKKTLEDAGGRIWDVLFGGIRQAVKDQDPSLIQVIAEKVAPAVARILQYNWQ